MALVRFFSGLLEMLAAVAFLRLGKVEAALRLNALLGLFGPLVFALVSLLGLTSIAVRLPPAKIVLLSLGIVLILIGTKI
ncbi:MAG: DUF2619 domain-containing protein [Firmicutes bacterium]|nr:DUF2619 domain-containing protein [Bacillota bacterium]